MVDDAAPREAIRGATVTVERLGMVDSAGSGLAEEVAARAVAPRRPSSAVGGEGGLRCGDDGGRRRCAALGRPPRLLGDVFPRGGTGSRWFEAASGVVTLLAFAPPSVPLDPVTIGAASAAAPDVEHVLSLPRPGGGPLFPTHRWKRLHHAGRRPGAAQFVLAYLLLAGLLTDAGRDRRPPSGRR